MKIAVTAVGSSMDAQVEARFGRAPYYIIVNTESMEYEAIENPNVSAGGGAGIQSAQLIAKRDVKFVLTGNCGPNAFNVFGTAGVQIITGVTGTVLQAVEQFKSGAFSATAQPNVESRSDMGVGMGSGRGMGGVMGSGRGMGGGMGSGRGMGGGRGVRFIDVSEGSRSQIRKDRKDRQEKNKKR
jgi:predicted Fe-Mo cluster-binding NifX family protein